MRLPLISVLVAAALSLRAAPEAITPNDNQRAAGRLRDGVLTVSLEARAGVWSPEGDAGPHVPVQAFAESGRPLEAPGPLLRVPLGTEVRVRVRNALAVPMSLYGLGATRGLAADSVRLEPGESRELRFHATEAGAFYYAGRTTSAKVTSRSNEDSQLHGAIVVDPPGVRPRDHVFVISGRYTIDPKTVSGLGPDPVLAFNGRSWPHTERFEVTQGDTLRWRFINVSDLEHPLHLHGAYFRVDGAGDGARDTTYAPAARRLAVTERLLPLNTLAIAWSPVHAGNWIFHCHFASHIAPYEAMEADRRMPAAPSHAAHAAHGADASAEPGMRHHMRGLVLGIHVKPRGAALVDTRPARPIRLIVRSRANVYGDYVGYAYVLGGSAAERVADSLPVPGPLLRLARGERVAITIVNRSHEPAAIHWHGIELESLADGVPGWSGSGTNVLPLIAPDDSLTVRFTPPRAGTFMYHSHSNEMQQISSGLYGAIIVEERGAPATAGADRVLVFSDGGPLVHVMRPPPPILLGGSLVPDTIDLPAGMPSRLRFVNIRTEYATRFALGSDDGPATWRIIAKDGASLPAEQVRVEPATMTTAPGEIHDVEFTPSRAGIWRLRYGNERDTALTAAIIRVRR